MRVCRAPSSHHSRVNVAEYHKPYVAVWVEPAGGGAARTLAVWYDVKKGGAEPGTKWLADLRTWWRKGGRSLKLPADGVSSITRAPGAHRITIPANLPAGAYTLHSRLAEEAVAKSFRCRYHRPGRPGAGRPSLGHHSFTPLRKHQKISFSPSPPERLSCLLLLTRITRGSRHRSRSVRPDQSVRWTPPLDHSVPGHHGAQLGTMFRWSSQMARRRDRKRGRGRYAHVRRQYRLPAACASHGIRESAAFQGGRGWA